MTRAVASFDVTGWDAGDARPVDDGTGGDGAGGGGPILSEAVVRKRFSGDLEGESEAQLMMYQTDPADITAGAGYIAREVVRGSLAGRAGLFVMQHWGLSEGGSERTGGHIVPGSGAGGLKGLKGSVEISRDGDGAHTLTVDYELPDSEPPE